MKHLCITDLPEELVWKIAEHLHPKDICRLLQTCRSFSSLKTFPLLFSLSKYPRNDLELYNNLNNPYVWNKRIVWSEQQQHMALREAVLTEDVEKIEYLLRNGIDIDVRDDDDGWTVLMWASKYSKVDIARFLIDKGASIDARDNYSETALFRACVHGNIIMAELFIEKGANVNATDMYGNSARSQTKYINVLQLLQAVNAR